MSKNGQLTDDELTPVQGTIQLANTTARAWLGLETATRTELGVDLNITSPAGGYRDLAMQRAMYANPAAFGAKTVATPGYSVHGQGRCVDIYNWAALGSRRLDLIAARFGFRRTIIGEAWHYQHDGVTATGGGGGGFNPLSGGNMFGFVYTPAVSWKFFCVPGDYIKNTPGAQAESVLALAGLSLGSIESLDELTEVMWTSGFGDQFGPGTPHATAWDLLGTLAGGGTLYTTASQRAQQGGSTPAPVDYDLLAQKTAALIKFPTTLTIDPPPATGKLS